MGWMLAEKHEITTGEFRGFVVGRTKQSAADNLLKLGGRDLMGISLPPDLMTPKLAPADIAAVVNNRNGIRVTDSQGLNARLFFEGDQIVAIENRGVDKVEQLFKIGQTRESVNHQLELISKDNRRIEVESIGRIDSAYWGVVNRDAAKAVNILRGYDGWHFIVPSEKPGGATYRLFFSEDRLIRLEYERPRFEK